MKPLKFNGQTYNRRMETLAEMSGLIEPSSNGDLSELIAKLEGETVPPETGTTEPTESKPSIVAPARFTQAQVEHRAIKTESGKLVGCIGNGLDQIRSEWHGVLGHDTFSGKDMFLKPPPFAAGAGAILDHHYTLTNEWLERRGCRLNSTAKVGEIIRTVARENSFDSLCDYFDGLPEWDGVPRVERFITDYMGAEDTALNRKCGQVIFVGGARRAMEPGSKHEIVPLFTGKQGKLKSWACEKVTPHRAWFVDHTSDLGGKDSRLELAGKFVIEFGELSQIKGQQLERVKSYISTRIDSYRPPYGRATIDQPRRCIFLATSNDQLPLTDETGGRRFIPITVGKIKLDDIERDRDQLWSEGLSMYRAGVTSWLDTQELEAQAKRVQDCAYAAGQWDERIVEWCDDPQPLTDNPGKPFLSTPNKVVLAEILEHAIRKPLDRWTTKDQDSVLRCLTHHGFEHKQVYVAATGKKPWMYVKP